MSESSRPGRGGDDGRLPDAGGEATASWETRAARGGALVLLAQAGQFAIGLVSTMILARLLVPADFGIVAMAGIVVGAMLTFKDFGLSLAIAQREALDDDDLSVLFWWSLAYTTGLALATAASGPLLAWFFDQPVLRLVTACLAVGLWLSGLVNIPLGLLRRRLRFGTIAIADTAGNLSGAVVAVALAFFGAGLWALVAQQVVLLTVQGALIALAARFRPGPPTRALHRPATRALLRFGGETTAVRVFNELAEQLDRVLVGRLMGAAALGPYYMSHRWSTLPALQLLVPLKGVAVATWSRLRADPERYRAAASEGMAAVLSLVLPVLSFLAADAAVVVPVLLGPAWVEAIPIFRILAIAAFFGCASRLMIWIYLAEARTAERLRFTVIARPISMLMVAAGAPFGVLGIAGGYAIGTGLSSVANVLYACSGSPFRASDFVRAAARPAIASVVAAVAVLVMASEGNDVVRLLLDGAVFSVAYAASWIAMPGGLPRARRSLAWILRRTSG